MDARSLQTQAKLSRMKKAQYHGNSPIALNIFRIYKDGSITLDRKTGGPVVGLTIPPPHMFTHFNQSQNSPQSGPGYIANELISQTAKNCVATSTTYPESILITFSANVDITKVLFTPYGASGTQETFFADATQDEGLGPLIQKLEYNGHLVGYYVLFCGLKVRACDPRHSGFSIAITKCQPDFCNIIKGDALLGQLMRIEKPCFLQFHFCNETILIENYINTYNIEYIDSEARVYGYQSFITFNESPAPAY